MGYLNTDLVKKAGPMDVWNDADVALPSNTIPAEQLRQARTVNLSQPGASRATDQIADAAQEQAAGVAQEPGKLNQAWQRSKDMYSTAKGKLHNAWNTTGNWVRNAPANMGNVWNNSKDFVRNSPEHMRNAWGASKTFARNSPRHMRIAYKRSRRWAKKHPRIALAMGALGSLGLLSGTAQAANSGMPPTPQNGTV